MMKKTIVIIFTVLLIVSFISCDKKVEPIQTPTISSTPVPTIQPTPTPSPSPTPTPVVPTPEPVPKSYSTGLPFDEPYEPVIAIIENSSAARPQIGLQTADVVYEVPVEGGITRFVCVFSDNVPEEIMPVRSMRVPFLYIATEWEGVFMHYGGAGRKSSELSKDYSAYGHDLYDEIVYQIDGLKGKWNDYYYRIKDKSAPHNVMGNPKLAQELYDYEPEPLNWLFASESAYTGKAVNEINIALCSNIDDYVSYAYDKTSNVYMRSMRGKEFIAAETDSQLSVTNIVIQYSTYTTASKGRKLWMMTGSNVAEFYIGGQYILGRWEKETDQDETMYYDSEGKQIVFMPGNTWIHLCPEE
jgi:hypothetical protein